MMDNAIVKKLGELTRIEDMPPKGGWQNKGTASMGQIGGEQMPDLSFGWHDAHGPVVVCFETRLVFQFSLSSLIEVALLGGVSGPEIAAELSKRAGIDWHVIAPGQGGHA